MFFIAYAFKVQVHVFAGQVKILSHSSCRTSAILKYFCPFIVLCYMGLAAGKSNLSVCVQGWSYPTCSATQTIFNMEALHVAS